MSLFIFHKYILLIRGNNRIKIHSFGRFPHVAHLSPNSPSGSESSACLPESACLFGFEIPETISSILKSMHADSMAVLYVYILTAHGSQILASSMFSILVVLPFIPHIRPGLGFPSVGA